MIHFHYIGYNFLSEIHCLEICSEINYVGMAYSESNKWITTWHWFYIKFRINQCFSQCEPSTSCTSSPWKLPEMLILRPYLDSLNQKLWSWCLAINLLSSLPGDSDLYWSLRTTAIYSLNMPSSFESLCFSKEMITWFLYLY